MATVIHLPVRPEVDMTDAELAAHLSGVAGKLLADVTMVEVERDCYRSAWVFATKRLEGKQVRCLRLVLGGMLLGAVVAWCLDGTAAQKIDHALRMVGI